VTGDLLRSLALHNALGPPMEARRRADEAAAGLQDGAAGGLGLLKIVERREVLVDQRRIGQRPQMLGGLQLR
jgi:hypothetical protein